jgi:hypothetical protein
MWASVTTFVSGREPVTETLPLCLCPGTTIDWCTQTDPGELTLAVQCPSCRAMLTISVNNFSATFNGEESQ